MVINKKSFTPYLWMGMSFFVLSFFSDLASHPDHTGDRVLNHLWKISYVTVLHGWLFVYLLAGIGKRPVISSVLLLLAQVLLYSWGLYLWRLLGIGLHIYTVLVTFRSAGHAVADQMTYCMTSLAFFTVANHFYQYIKLRNTAQQLRIEKQQAELNYLKSQTNPHFLFNTLNNIYSLSRAKSDLAPQAILRLSKILRFMLYESSGKTISVDQEIKIINDYIELEKLRYDETLHVDFRYEIEDGNQFLPPLLLMPLVENAFKHGAAETRGCPFVDINLTVQKKHVKFVVKNSIEEAKESITENIGLSNLRRQLELLYTDYNLAVVQKDKTFTAALHINLTSHA